MTYKPIKQTYSYSGALGSLAQMQDKPRRVYNKAIDDLKDQADLDEPEADAMEILMALSEYFSIERGEIQPETLENDDNK